MDFDKHEAQQVADTENTKADSVLKGGKCQRELAVAKFFNSLADLITAITPAIVKAIERG
jgi:hypothetical protein